MNSITFSAECLHSMCPACTYLDCACRCHLIDQVNAEEPCRPGTLAPGQTLEEFCDAYLAGKSSEKKLIQPYSRRNGQTGC